MTCFIVGAVLTVRVYQERQTQRQQAQSELRRQAVELSVRTGWAYETIARDLEILKLTPPIQGIVRARHNNGVDVAHNSTFDDWQQRLETIFESFLYARPEYHQIRFIGVADGGREIVRMDHLDNQLVRTPSERLQKKGGRDYFNEAIHLNDGEVAFSEVDQNIEFGKPDSTAPSTIRGFTPVISDKGEVFGFLIINAHWKLLMQEVIAERTGDCNILVMTPDGNCFAVHQPGENLSITNDPTDLSSLSATQARGEGVITHGHGVNRHIAYYLDTTVGRVPHRRSVRIVVDMSGGLLYSSIAETTRQNMIMAFCATLLLAIVSFYFGRHITKPLLDLDEMIRNFGDDTCPRSLLVERRDEIGAIARSYHGLVDKLERSRQSERRAFDTTEAVVRTSVDGVVLFDATGTIVSANPASEQMLDRGKDQLVGQSIDELLPGLREPDTDDQARELVVTLADESQLDLETSVTDLNIVGEQQLFSLLLRDITQRKADERALREQTEQLQSTVLRLDNANEEVRQFAHIVSHDLRAPLVNLQGFSDFLTKGVETLREHLEASSHPLEQGDIDLLRERIPSATKYIRESTMRMQQQLDSILQVSRLGRYTLSPKQINLAVLFSEICESHLGPKWSSAVTLDLDEIPVVEIDEKAIRTIATNLCSNAIKYQVPERPLAIKITGRRSDTQLEIAISDNGRGIAPADCEKVFQLFKRCGRPDTDGEGVGLAFTKTVVERLGGTIVCESILGEGTTFSITLPQLSFQPRTEEPCLTS